MIASLTATEYFENHKLRTDMMKMQEMLLDSAACVLSSIMVTVSLFHSRLIQLLDIHVYPLLNIWKQGQICNNSEIFTSFKAIICREKSKTLSTNKGRFYNNNEINALISKRLSVENKAKLSQLTRADFVRIAKLAH